jgi:hypothetical protein
LIKRLFAWFQGFDKKTRFQVIKRIKYSYASWQVYIGEKHYCYIGIIGNRKGNWLFRKGLH